MSAKPRSLSADGLVAAARRWRRGVAAGSAVWRLRGWPAAARLRSSAGRRGVGLGVTSSASVAAARRRSACRLRRLVPSPPPRPAIASTAPATTTRRRGGQRGQQRAVAGAGGRAARRARGRGAAARGARARRRRAVARRRPAAAARARRAASSRRRRARSTPRRAVAQRSSGVLGQPAVEDGVDAPAEVRAQLGARGGSSSMWARAWAAKCSACERLLAGQQLEGDDGERVAVRGGGRRLAHRLLGRDVGGGAEHLAGLGDLRVAGRRAMPKSPIASRSWASSSRLAGLTSRCTIPAAWAASSAGGGLAQPAQRGRAATARRSRRRRRSATVPPAKCSMTMNGAAVVLADVVDRHDVRMLGDPRGGAGLALEARAGTIVLRADARREP